MWCDQYHEHIEGNAILAIVADPAFPESPDKASFWTIDFYVEGYRLSLSANPDTDEIQVAVDEAALLPDATSLPHPALASLIGNPFGWCWSAVNSQGYSDMLILDWRDGGWIRPQIAFLVEASTINLLRIAPV